MNIKPQLLSILLVLGFCLTYGQKNKRANYFDNPIVVDSLSTIIIPTKYNPDFFSSKIGLWSDFYANIIFYNFTTDTYKQLFDTNTYIDNHRPYYWYRESAKQPLDITSKWIFYRIKNIDRNKSGDIDDKDPEILYVTDLHGDNLKKLTSENENVISIDIFDKQNFALIKIQRDQNNDGDFKSGDKDFYYVKLDLTTLTLGNKIEIKSSDGQ